MLRSLAIQEVVVFERKTTIGCSKKGVVMLCPYCSHPETRVTDKRDTGSMTKRRRECLKCERRFNTQEAVEQLALRVIKKDGRREDFERGKLHRGILRACEKRPITSETIDKMITAIEEKLRQKGNEVTSMLIGKQVIKELKKIDQVAYIRFASVYREFGDIADFKREIKELVRK